MTFVLHASTPNTYCLIPPATCSFDWLSIQTDAGAELPVDNPCPLTIVDAGMFSGCCQSTPLGPSGVTRIWAACLVSGAYVAKMCAFAGTVPQGGVPACSPGHGKVCSEIPFTWPPAGGSAMVQGMLP
jgi:hypothetical protein